MSRARRVRGGAVAKESVRGTAWPRDEAALAAAAAEPRCPECDGELEPIMVWNRVLNPRMRCQECGAVWLDAEALSGPWLRPGGFQESRLIRQHFVLMQALMYGGGVLLLSMAIGWLLHEEELARGPRPGLEWVWDDPTPRVWVDRIAVPVLAVSWVGLLIWMNRFRAKTTPTAVAAIGWLIAASAFMFVQIV